MGARKIAILGGGMSALTAAYYLSSQPDWQEKYDITLYQMGWRLGGKAANGRDQEHWDRNEEHGYHMLFGFYENTFATMRAVYKDLNRSPEEPLSEFIAPTAEDEKRYPQRYAMKRNSLLYLPQRFNDEFQMMGYEFPTNDLLPGDGDEFDLLAMLENLLGWLPKVEAALTHPTEPPIHLPSQNRAQWLNMLSPHLPELAARLGSQPEGEPPMHGAFHFSLHIFEFARAGNHLESEEKCAGIFDIIVDIVRWHMRCLWASIKDRVMSDWKLYQLWIVEDFVATIICGFLGDKLLVKGFDSINDQNFYDWFVKHGTIPEGTQLSAQSVLMQFAYTACFAFEDGDATSPRKPNKPVLGAANMEAGTMLRGGMRLFLTYRGSLDWLFQAGAGDVLVGPLYEVLTRRGVKIKFFQKVKKLVAPKDSGVIQSIVIENQVTLNVGQYQPMITIKDLPCWPNKPLYEQIVEAKELQNRHIDLESFWTDWQGKEYTLEHGKDFDDVLLGISIGALQYICQDLIDQSPAWASMVSCVKTVRTADIQTWLNKDLAQLGWTKGLTIGDTGVEPMDMIADATETIQRENWPGNATPQNQTFFGGVMPDDPNQPQPPAPAYPPTQQELGKVVGREYVEQYASIFWPNAKTPDGFDWSILVDLQNPDAKGPARFDAQHWHVNIDPSERYVLSVVGSSLFRMATDQSGFKNLYLTGDWIKNGLNCGCMEATVMSGMQAARAISRESLVVRGEKDF